VIALKENGANKIYCYCTHPLLVGKAYEYIEEMPLEKLLVTDTIPLKRKFPKIEVLSVGKMLGEAILRIHKEESVSSLFIEPEGGGGNGN
jgi:ribose-phosphate pyrophosphokinase